MSVLAIKPTFVNTKFKTSQWEGLNEPPVPGITETCENRPYSKLFDFCKTRANKEIQSSRLWFKHTCMNVVLHTRD